MVRCFPTLLAGVAVALAGCGDQGLEGAWYGPFPLEDARDCRTRLSDGRFDLSCQGDAAWVGEGAYSREGDTLRLQFTALARRGELIRPVPAPLDLRMERMGNTMRLGSGRDAGYEWVRTMGRP